jgi:cytochrome P450
MFRGSVQDGGPPGTRPLPVVGDLIALGRDPLNFLPELQRRFGDVAQWSFGSKRVVTFFHPDDVGSVFAAAGAQGPLGRGHEGSFARYAGVTGSNGLIVSEGAYWKRQRRTLQPGMHPEWIADYATIIVGFAEEMARGFSAGQERNMQEDMEQLVGRIAVKTLLGADLADAVADKLKRTSDRMLMLNTLEYALGSTLPTWVPTPLRYLLKTTSSRMERLIMAAIGERLGGARPTGLARQKDMLDMLLQARDEDGQSLTERQLRDEIYTLYLAGYETTANTLGIIWTLLAGRADLQERLFEEIERAVGNGTLGYEHAEALQLTQAVVKETLRMYPVVRLMNHYVNRPLRVGGYEFGPGYLVCVVPGVTQRDSRWFESPDDFRPDRWLDGSTDGIPRFAWFPFGGGPRICLGQRLAVAEMVLIIAAVLRRFVVSAAGPDQLSLKVNGGGHLVCTNAHVLLGSRSCGAENTG